MQTNNKDSNNETDFVSDGLTGSDSRLESNNMLRHYCEKSDENDFYELMHNEEESEGFDDNFLDDFEVPVGDDCIFLDMKAVSILLSDSKSVFCSGNYYYVPSGISLEYKLGSMWVSDDRGGMYDCLENDVPSLEYGTGKFSFHINIYPVSEQPDLEAMYHFLLYKKGRRFPIAVWICKTDITDILLEDSTGRLNLEPGDYVWAVTNMLEPKTKNRDAIPVVIRELNVASVEIPCDDRPEPGLLIVADEGHIWNMEVPISGASENWKGYTVTVYDSGWRLLTQTDNFTGNMSFSNGLLPYVNEAFVLMSHKGELVAGYMLHRIGKNNVSSELCRDVLELEMREVCRYLEKKVPWGKELSKTPGMAGVRKALVKEAYYLHFCEKSDMVHNAIVLETVDDGYSVTAVKALAKLLTGYTINIVDVRTVLAQTGFNLSGLPSLDELETSSPVCLMNAGMLVQSDANRLLEMLQNYMEKGPITPVVLCDTREKISGLFKSCTKLASYYQKELDFVSEGITVEDAFIQVNIIIEDMKLELTKESRDKLMEYLHRDLRGHRWTKLELHQFVMDRIVKPFLCTRTEEECMVISDITLPEPVAARDDFAEAMSELDAMVGLKELKSGLHGLFDVLRLSRCREEKGYTPLIGSVHHCIFTGNPGTGKSTVAALMGKLFKSLGILSEGQVVSVERRTLIGTYIGQTERNLSMILQQAKGNVLFIDEAYSLSVGNGNEDNDFGNQALQGLLTALAVEKPDMVVIMAGYKKDIDRMLSRNQGMAGRFPYRFDFVDFTSDELLEIGNMVLKKKQLEMTPEAISLFKKYVEKELKGKGDDFSNARWITQLIENKLIPVMAGRVMNAKNLSDESLSKIEESDIRNLVGRNETDTNCEGIRLKLQDMQRYFFLRQGKNYGSLN